MKLKSMKLSVSSGNALVAALLVVTIGCDSGPKLRPDWAIVSGTVTYQGKPLPGGEVMWCIERDGCAILRGGVVREDGTFTLDTPIGLAKVAIHTADLKKAQSSRYVDVPAKYTDPESSGLIYEAKAGENNDVRFELE